MADVGEAKNEVVEAIVRAAKEDKFVAVRDLAEAYAWLIAPSNSHGGGSKSS